MGIKVIGKLKDAKNFIDDNDIFVAIGNNSLREKIHKNLENYGANIPVLIHPKAIIGTNVEIGNGTVVMAGVIINPSSKVGKGCIINTGSTIDHDNNLEDFIHLSPGSHLAGNVKVGKGSWLGIGSIISNNVYITENCIIGAGFVVLEDIYQSGTYVGVPARKISK